jgi:hypothetical protein
VHTSLQRQGITQCTLHYRGKNCTVHTSLQRQGIAQCTLYYGGKELHSAHSITEARIAQCTLHYRGKESHSAHLLKRQGITQCTLHYRGKDLQYRLGWPAVHTPRVGQNRKCTPYMTECMVISLLIIPYIHCIYVCMCGFGQPFPPHRKTKWHKPSSGYVPCVVAGTAAH